MKGEKMIKTIDFEEFTEEELEERKDEAKGYFEKQLEMAKKETEEFAKKKFFVINKINGEIDSIKNYIKELQGTVKRKENALEFQKSICRGAVLETENEKIETVAGRMTLRKSSQVIITDENIIHEDYKEIKEVVTISKKQIKEAIENGRAVDGAIIQTNKSIQMKG